MRSPWEAENRTISAEEATARGRRFGWGKIFESGNLNSLTKNSKGIKAFGQGIHALQDAFAHKGRSDVNAQHLLNDRIGSTKDSENVSQTVVTVHNLLSENWTALDKTGISLTNLEGISKRQFSQVLSQIAKYFTQKDKEEEKN